MAFFNSAVAPLATTPPSMMMSAPVKKPRRSSSNRVNRAAISSGRPLRLRSVGARELVCALGHDKLRGKVSAHAGGVDYTVARCHDLVKGIVDVDRAQRVAAQNLLGIAYVRATVRLAP